MSERISTARTVTERKDYLALRERGEIATPTARNDKRDCHATLAIDRWVASVRNSGRLGCFVFYNKDIL